MHPGAAHRESPAGQVAPAALRGVLWGVAMALNGSFPAHPDDAQKHLGLPQALGSCFGRCEAELMRTQQSPSEGTPCLPWSCLLPPASGVCLNTMAMEGDRAVLKPRAELNHSGPCKWSDFFFFFNGRD